MLTTLDVETLAQGSIQESDLEYARRKLLGVLRFTAEPVRSAKVKLRRLANPSLSKPCVCQGNLDIDGSLLRAQVVAAHPAEAVDLMTDRLRRTVARMAQHWEARRGRLLRIEPRPWCDRQLPASERHVVRHKTYPLRTASVDEAAAEMNMMDFDFHLFIERGSGQDSVLYRCGPSRYRLSQLRPQPHRRWNASVPLSITHHPAPYLSLRQAIARLEATGLPFVFFADLGDGRARLLYHRHDGHYGVIRPAEPAHGTFDSP
jgi:hypothetical protein